MCGRFSLSQSPEELLELFGIHITTFEPSYNIAPSHAIIAIRNNDQNTPECTYLQWGFIPSWAKLENLNKKLINARIETVNEKPTFKRAYQRRRCLIPADGFFEWKQHNNIKQPYWFHLENKPVFTLAGIWEQWQHEDHILETCAILTTEATGLMEQYHQRMPVIINQNQYHDWLDTSKIINPDQLNSITDISTYPVSTKMNNPLFNEKQAIEAI